MKKNINILLSLIVVMLALGLFSGCTKEEKSTKADFSIYYVNKEGTKIENKSYSPKATATEQLIFELLEKLSENVSDEDLTSAIPDTVAVNGYDLTDGIATIDFDDRYYDMDTQREVLCRAAVVMTISQVEDVEYVAFTINDFPYQIPGGSFVGVMKASDFVADLSGEDNDFARADFKLYFANEDGTKLKEYVLEDAKYGEKSKERFVVEQLINGPQKSGYTATLSSDINLVNIVTANNVCYVDFEENFNTEISKVSNQLVIYSIVNSLSELKGIHKVQISINGDSAVKYHDDISLSETFTRDLDLIEQNKK